MNSLTVNLHLLMASFYRPARPPPLHRDRGRRVLLGPACRREPARLARPRCRRRADRARTGRGQRTCSTSPQLEALLAARGDEVALVLWPGVQYRTGQAFDLARIAAAAHRAGALCGFDLAHAIGNLPLALHDAGADFAVWCSYKYLNAGPGRDRRRVRARAPRRARTLPGLAGWWGHDPATRFRMEPGFVPAPGAAAGRSATRRSSRPRRCSPRSQLFDAAGIGALRASRSR